MTTTETPPQTSGTAPAAAGAAIHPNKILDGKAVAAEIRAEVAEQVAALVGAGHRRPGLAAVLVGGDPASHVYVDSKAAACEEVGMLGRVVRLDGGIAQAELDRTVDELNADDEIDGILVQLPLPEQLTERTILDRIDPDKDVDGFHPINVGRLWLDLPGFVPATPSGIVEMLDRRGVDLHGKHAVVVGRSHIVGKPMAALLLRRHATVTVCHSRTKDLAATCRRADLLVAAVGRTGTIGPDHVKEGAVVVDVGMNRLTTREEVEHYFPGDAERMGTFERRGSTLVGDVDFTRVAPKASAITPVPGGVGPLTIAMLLVNTLTAARRRQGLEGPEGAPPP
jgi:methylenetetrahydrofolate dehydrogenase (NADP+) / methenyltetrahydrofolate cyclohydrolase